MSVLGDLSNKTVYQFARWPSSSSRSHSSSTTSKDFINETSKLSIDIRNHISRSNSSSIKRTIKHHIHIPTDTDQTSPPIVTPPSTSPELTRKSSPHSINSRRYRSIPVRIQSTPLTIPLGKIREDNSLKNFPKQTHEQQKITRNRKRRKQEAQFLADKYAQNQNWFQLKRSLAELKRLATTQDILVEPSTTILNYDEQSSFENQIHLNHDEQKKLITLQCESGLSSSFNLTYSTCDFNRTNLSISRSRLSNQSIESYSKYTFQPFLITSKPIHTSCQSHSFSKPKYHPPKSPPYRSRPITTPLTEEKRSQLLISDLSNDDRLSPSKTPSPPPVILAIEQENQPIKRIIRAPSTMQLTSTIKLKSQPPRCRSANEMKSTLKIYARFIIIADPEHRIESWYHQYPFVHADDLIDAFQSKQKTTISAYFIDDSQTHHRHTTAKIFLQGKPFHIENDWKKYDLIFISNQIYDQIMTYLQLIIKTSGKIIQIYQLNHDEDLKRQIKSLIKLFQQQNI